MDHAVTRFDSSSGARIYRIPMTVFNNGFVGYSYLVLEAGPPTLVDTGSGVGESNNHLLAGIAAVRHEHGEALNVTDIERIIITHGHMDHFGGAAFMAEQTGAQVGIHALDRSVLTNYDERVIVATKDLRVYLERAGIGGERRQKIIEMYGFLKQFVRTTHADFSIDEDTELDGMHFIHTPGHCPGQVCIMLGDTMLAADHILSQTTPHQAPESITAYTGLGHYLDSLRKVAKIDGIALSLGGHEDPVHTVYDRIEAIQQSHERKLNRVLDIIKDTGQPLTIGQITEKMYPNKAGYEILLALEEAGAHVEYLYQRGALAVANLDEVAGDDNPALRYTIN